MFSELHQRPEPTNIPFIPICKAVTTPFLSGETLHNWVFIGPTWETSDTCLWTCTFLWDMFDGCSFMQYVLFFLSDLMTKNESKMTTNLHTDCLCPGKLTHDFLHLKNLLGLFYCNWNFWNCLSWSVSDPSLMPQISDFWSCLQEFPSLFLSYGTVITMNLQRHWCIFFWHLTVHMGLSWHLRALSGWHWVRY